MEFKGFDGWIEIFKGGPQTDSQGRNHDGDKIIDNAVKQFNSTEHEPPVVVGHPKDNSPAFGWVDGVKAEDKGGVKYLFAKCKDMVPEFADLVKQGVYKKRSAAFYPDGRLRHVGFLGGMPPAVKGLADIGFKDGDESLCFEFNPAPEFDEGATDKEGAMTAAEFMEAIKFWKQHGGQAAEAAPEKPGEKGGEFTEADIAAAKKEAAEEAAKTARKEAAAEFAETQKKERDETRKKEIAAFMEAGVKDGKIPPAWKDAGMQEFMEGLDGEGEIEFSEGKKQSPSEWFREFLEGLPKVINFGEVATRGKDVGGGDAGSKLGALVTKKMQDNKGMEYSEALSVVSSENPDLATEYEQEMTG